MLVEAVSVAADEDGELLSVVLGVLAESVSVEADAGGRHCE